MAQKRHGLPRAMMRILPQSADGQETVKRRIPAGASQNRTLAARCLSGYGAQLNAATNRKGLTAPTQSSIFQYSHGKAAAFSANGQEHSPAFIPVSLLPASVM